MRGPEPFATIHKAMRMLLLLLTKPFGHLVDIFVTLLRNPGSMPAHFFNNRVDIHPNAPIP
jgi:hypothetical protein